MVQSCRVALALAAKLLATGVSGVAERRVAKLAPTVEVAAADTSEGLEEEESKPLAEVVQAAVVAAGMCRIQ
jgi:hypothetical protein